MSKSICIRAVALFMLLPIFTFGQDSDIGSWFIYIGNKKLNSKWSLHHEVQYRNYDIAQDLEQLLLRTGLQRKISNNSSALLGYGYILSENYIGEDKVTINEHRIFQQLITKQKFKSIKVQHRYRLEQRWIEDNDIRHRARYFLALQAPIKRLENNRQIYLSVYNEVFLNLQDEVFDRNRIYGALGYTMNDHLKIELGYMTQVFKVSSRDQLTLSAFANF